MSLTTNRDLKKKSHNTDTVCRYMYNIINVLFQEDNVSLHHAHIVTQFQQQYLTQNMTWPPRSYDFNFIEQSGDDYRLIAQCKTWEHFYLQIGSEDCSAVCDKYVLCVPAQGVQHI